MRETRGNLWDFYHKGYIVCITTNGTVKKDGRAVMGRGCARQARDMFPEIDLDLGRCIKENGNRVHILRDKLLSFPVKHNWWERADIQLIKRSANELVRYADIFGWNNVVIPRPGCGNGGLKWEDVKPVLESILDDRFIIVCY